MSPKNVDLWTKNRTQWNYESFMEESVFSIWLDNFITAKKAENLSKGTIEFYKYRLLEFEEFLKDKHILHVIKVNSNHIREFLFDLVEKGHTPGGVHGYYRTVKVFFRWYENESYVQDLMPNWHNPISKVKSPKVPEEILEPANIDDVYKMIAVCPDTILGLRDKALVYFCMDTGVRAAELVALDLKDVSTLGDVVIKSGKGHKPRVVYLGSKSRKVLKLYLKQRTDTNPALWITDDGNRLTYRGVKMIMRRRAEKAGVKTPALHSFRRFFALECLKNHMSVFALQKLLGHSDLSVLKRYLKQTNQDIKEEFVRASPVDNLNT